MKVVMASQNLEKSKETILDGAELRFVESEFEGVSMMQNRPHFPNHSKPDSLSLQTGFLRNKTILVNAFFTSILKPPTMCIFKPY